MHENPIRIQTGKSKIAQSFINNNLLSIKDSFIYRTFGLLMLLKAMAYHVLHSKVCHY